VSDREYYNYFRYYDPSTGRYVTADPIGLAGGLNTYSYVGNNPLYWIDPFGLEAMPVPAGPIPLPIPNPTPYGSDANKTLAKGLDDLIGRLLGSLPSIRIECMGTKCFPVMHNKEEDSGSDENKDCKKLPLDVGGETWGKNNGVGAAEGRRRAHRAKQRDPMSGATDIYTVDPNTGTVYDPEGEYVGNLNDDYF